MLKFGDININGLFLKPFMEIHLTKKGKEALAEKVLDLITDEIFTRSQENLVEMGKIDTGFLLRSGNVIREKGKRKIVYSAPYSGYIEYGTLPHFPPVEPIFEWVKRKMGKSDKKAERIAWAVANKIAQQGTKPYPFLREAVYYVRGKYAKTR